VMSGFCDIGGDNASAGGLMATRLAINGNV
jgi:hypothetical protein